MPRQTRHTSNAPRRNPRRTPRSSPMVPRNQMSLERMQNRPYTFVKTIDKGIIQSSTSANTYGSLQFLANDLPEISSYANIFDQYRLSQIVLQFLPVITAAVPSATASNFAPVIYTAIDYDDNGVPTSIATVLNYFNIRFYSPGQRFKIAFRPHAAIAGFTGTFGAYVNVPAPWIDCASLTAQHYGLKYAMPSASFVSSWQLIASYTISFRNVR
jgi:hypothetical protein